jgi:hypothetical protein
MRAARRPASIAIAFGAAAAATLAACGGGDDGEEGGPASVVPASAPAYVEIVVQPDGEAADDAEAALAKVSGSDDPGGDLVALLERASREEGDSDFDFSEDIGPWLGERMGIYPSSLAGDTETILVIETTDSEAALESVREQEDATGKEQEYEGHTFELDSDGDAFGIVDDFLVFGRPAGFRQVVDTAEDGDPLADESKFEDSVESLPDDRLAMLYAVPSGFIEAIPANEIDPQGKRILLQAMGESGDEPVLGDLTASAEAVTLEFSAAGAAVDTEPSELLGRLPADSWFALATGDVGEAVQRSLDQTAEAGVPGLNAETLTREIRAQTGLDLEQDVIPALGDAGLFVQGTSEQSLGGALVIEGKDPEASARLLTKVQELITATSGGAFEVEPLASTSGDQGFQITLPQSGSTGGQAGEPSAADVGSTLTQPITVIQRDERIVAGYGGEAVNQALEPQGVEPLSETETFKSATEAVGGLGIDAFVSFAPVLQFAEGAGLADDPDYKEVKPYLDALSFLALATGGEDDRGVVRFTLGLSD